MEFKTDDRGVSEVIGAILVFGLLVALLAVMQTYAIPLANEEVEFNHNQQVQSDLVEFQESASRTGSQGTRESVKIQMGTTYPARLLFFSPNNPAGEIRTSGEGTARVENIAALDPTVRKYIEGSTADLETNRIEYRPGYNEYRNPPTTVLEYGVLYNDYGDQRVVENPGSVVNGNNINLMFFAGDLSRTSGTALSLDSSPASAPARTVTVTPTDNNQPVNIILPSRLPAEEWREVLSDEMGTDGNVERVVQDSSDTVIIQLDQDVNRYTLRMPKIGVGNNVQDEDPRYIINAKPEETTVAQGQATDLSIEIRDKYNNPVRDETVFISVSRGSLGPNSNSVEEVRTNDQGRANIRFNAPSNTGPVDVEASLRGDPNQVNNFAPNSNEKDLRYEMEVVDVIGVVGNDPQIPEYSIQDSECNQGTVLDTFFGDDRDRAGFEVHFKTTLDVEGSQLESAEVALKRESGRIGDRAEYDLSGVPVQSGNPDYQEFEDTLELFDVEESGFDPCSEDYTIRLIVTTDGGADEDAVLGPTSA